MKEILLIGCGGHCKSIIDIIESEKKWNIIGLIGQKKDVGMTTLNYPVIGTDQDLISLRKKYDYSFVAIGKIGQGNKRKSIINNLKSLDFFIPSLISKFSIVSRYSSIGTGSSIGHGVIVNAGAKIASHCIINSRSIVEHDVNIGDFCHISTGTIINGGVSIGENSFIGSGTIIREGIRIPPNTVISAGKRIMGWPVRVN